MNTKDISEFFDIDKWDIYEIWKKAEHIGENIVQSEYGRFAREVLDDAGKVIGRVLIDVLEDKTKEVVENAVEAVIEKIREIG